VAIYHAGLTIACVFSLIAILAGVRGNVEIARDQKALRGSGLADIGIFLGILFLIAGILSLRALW
jgi:uncharacterized membrane protein HdeD (DUF308 family)